MRPRPPKAVLFPLASCPFYSIVCDVKFRPVGVVAQLAERLVRNEKVAGSIPVGSTIQYRGFCESNPRCRRAAHLGGIF